MKDKAIHDAMVSIENDVRDIYNQGFSDGYEEGESEAKLIETIDNMNRQYRSGYSKGLEEAWECARKLLFDSSLPRDILTELGADSFCGVIHKCSASEAMAKLKEYEKCQDCKYAGNPPHAVCGVCVSKNRFEPKQTEEKTDKSCESCRFVDLQEYEFPCSACSASHTFRWEARKGAEE